MIKKNSIIFILSFIIIFSSSCKYKPYVGDSISYNKRNICVLKKDWSEETLCQLSAGGWNFSFKVMKIDNDEYQIQGEAQFVGMMMANQAQQRRRYQLLLINNGIVVDSMRFLPKDSFQIQFQYKDDFDAVLVAADDIPASKSKGLAPK